MSDTSYVKSNFVFDEFVDLYDALNELMDDNDSGMREMALKIRAKFDKYWGHVEKMNKLLYMSVVLDPRHKFVFVEFVFNQIFGIGSEIVNKMIQSMRDAIEELFKCYSIKFKLQNQSKVHNPKVQHQMCLVSILLVNKLEEG